MTVEMVIIGLGQIGASVGMALADPKGPIHCTGFDSDTSIEAQAEKLKAIAKRIPDLPRAVSQADIVLLALPLNAQREMLEIVAPCMKEGAVLLDVSPAKEAMIAWTEELLPTGRYYVGLVPAINPAFLEARGLSLKVAHADLFRKGVMGVVTPNSAPPAAIKLATDLVGLLGAEHLFFDAVEVDSLMAAVHLLPQLAGAALVDATIPQPGWREGRKLAGRMYADVTGTLPQSGGPGSLAHAALLSKKPMLRVLDNLISALQDYRDEIENDQVEPLLEHLSKSYEDRLLWWSERHQGGWMTDGLTPKSELPTGSQFFKQMLTGTRKPKK